MSSKFFTWTKGDRRNASEALRAGGLVPIPAECISIKGVDYGRSIKHSRKSSTKPSPLTLEDSPEGVYHHGSRTADSIAFHDAAVQSATNLMAVMNDMLCSPPMTAHLFTQTYPPRLKPMHGRPRSRTAPSTPLAEAPQTEYIELPGSYPFDKKLSYLGSQTGSVDHLSANTEKAGHTNPDTWRPLPSPRERLPAPLTDMNTSRQSSPARRTLEHSKVQHHTSTGVRYEDSSNDSTENTLAPPDRQPLSLRIKQPMYSPLSATTPHSFSLPPSLSSSRTASTTAIPQASDLRQEHAAKVATHSDTGFDYYSEMRHLRRTHETHLESLKEVHEKEVASLRSYIMFLEDRPHTGSARDTTSTDRRPANAGHDTSQERCSTNAQPQIHPDLLFEPQVRTENADNDIERLRAAAEASGRKLQHLSGTVRKAKENEKALKNTIADLEARLAAANDERTDVLEGFHDACTKVHELSNVELTLQKRLEDRKGSDSTPNHTTAVSDTERFLATAAPLWQQMQELRCTIRERDAQIKQLEEALAVEPDFSAVGGRLSSLEEGLEQHKQMLADARADCEKYNALLHRELRRQSRAAIGNDHAQLSGNDGSTDVVLTERMARLQASVSPGTSHALAHTPDAMLEKELNRCIKEIITYKFEAKGYRKELRKATARVESLQAEMDERPAIPERRDVSSQRSHSSLESLSGQLPQPSPYQDDSPASAHPGLGISCANLNDTGRFATATSTGPISPAPAPHKTAASSPRVRRLSPLSVDKKLPRPPIFAMADIMPTTPPPTDARLQRTATLWSLSESIISSYSKRTTQEHGFIEASEWTAEALHDAHSGIRPQVLPKNFSLQNTV